ncbi:CPBP family intramembrane glutamic endopeptidase [Lentilactobacillus diolivorans]|uniref:CAAX prenyl protease 2/Lysostaphin resistance protein A-like domain-containing protein n=1 Tax=Lentilactobacillus diolivorans TaxID=179838 RepID=A0ABQ0XB28_9LACO|nr:CPBP family intramembrane glutamic endopeptidase [Lentilactobacillus diolivorans]GEP23303.1 hypothetical protein LDI01_08960 [Lentilactobacillus diolivorans]
MEKVTVRPTYHKSIINGLKLVGWIIFNRLMALPVFISYLVSKHPGPVVQISVATVSILLGVFSLWVLSRSYQRNLAASNPGRFQTDVSITTKNALTWIIVISIAVIYIVGRAIIESKISISNPNGQMTNTIYNSYPVAFFFLLNFFGPVGEELTIRGLFFAYFLKSNTRLNQIIVLILSSVLFMLLHGSFIGPAALYYLASGLFLGGIYLVTRNLQYSIFVHIVFNLAAAVLGI